MSMPNRIWRPIIDYHGLYEVSNQGEVRSLHKSNRRRDQVENLLEQQKFLGGYKGVFLHKNGKRKGFLVHRLVAQAFIPNPQNLPEVNHKNENKTDNNSDNLEWVSHKQNISYSRNIEKAYTKASKIVAVFKADGTFVGEYRSIHEAAEKLGLQFDTIRRRIAQNSSKEYKGLIFKTK